MLIILGLHGYMVIGLKGYMVIGLKKKNPIDIDVSKNIVFLRRFSKRCSVTGKPGLTVD